MNLGNKADGDARQVFAVCLHATGCSLREIQTILRFIGVNTLIKQSGTGYIDWLIAFPTRRCPRERCSRAAHQNAKRSEDGFAVVGS